MLFYVLIQETERYFHRVNRRAYARGVDGLDAYVLDRAEEVRA